MTYRRTLLRRRGRGSMGKASGDGPPSSDTWRVDFMTGVLSCWVTPEGIGDEVFAHPSPVLSSADKRVFGNGFLTLEEKGS
jgi:hypothetical protein